jgi:hypothetical protein
VRIDASLSADSHRRSNGAAVAAQVDDLAGDQFALAVGIGGDDQLGRLRQKLL